MFKFASVTIPVKVRYEIIIVVIKWSGWARGRIALSILHREIFQYQYKSMNSV